VLTISGDISGPGTTDRIIGERLTASDVYRTAHASRGRLITILPPKAPPTALPCRPGWLSRTIPSLRPSRGLRLPTEPLTCSFRWNPPQEVTGSVSKNTPDLGAPYGIEP
jgi:hypothetical protein